MTPSKRAIAEPLPREHDRRVKYSDIDRLDVLARVKNGEAQRAISRDTGISRRMISFWLHPERLEKVKKQFKERGQSRISYEKERGAKWAERMRDIRARHIALYGKKYGVRSRKV